MRLPGKVPSQLLKLLRLDRAPVHLQLPRAVEDPDVRGYVVVVHGNVDGRPADPGSCRLDRRTPSAEENL